VTARKTNKVQVIVPEEVAVALDATSKVRMSCAWVLPEGTRCSQNQLDHLHQRETTVNGRVRAQCVGRHHPYSPDFTPFFDRLDELGYALVPAEASA